jgi:hypothetical protein
VCSPPPSTTPLADPVVDATQRTSVDITTTSASTPSPAACSTDSSPTPTSATITTTSSTSTATTTTTTSHVSTKPKRKIFSSKNREQKNRAVFSAKNFWTSEKTEFDDEFGAEGAAGGEPSATTSSAVNPANNNKNKLVDDFDNDEEYVVLHRVKKAHQCHDLGETEQFDDDIKYHLSGIDVSNTSAMRCLR